MNRAVVGLAAFFVSAALHAAGVEILNAWMRPAPAGAEAARAYLDIRSDTTLDLVGASTPAAKGVSIVRLGTIGDASTEKVVKEMPVLGGTTTRLAYLGDHLRLTELTRDASNAAPVQLTLVFRDRDGKRIEAKTEVAVRGILMPSQVK